jgi:hypothetical protein
MELRGGQWPRFSFFRLNIFSLVDFSFLGSAKSRDALLIFYVLVLPCLRSPKSLYRVLISLGSVWWSNMKPELEIYLFLFPIGERLVVNTVHETRTDHGWGQANVFMSCLRWVACTPSSTFLLVLCLSLLSYLSSCVLGGYMSTGRGVSHGGDLCGCITGI